MKHTKRILAIMLAALFLVAMVPTAFAANEKLTLTCDKDQFEFTVYKVATLANTTTGAYTIHATDANVKSAIATACGTEGSTLRSTGTAPWSAPFCCVRSVPGAARCAEAFICSTKTV